MTKSLFHEHAVRYFNDQFESYRYRMNTTNNMKRTGKMFRKFCLESTILGLKYFYLHPDFLSRCFWAVNMAVIWVFAVVLMCLLYHRYEAMPTRIAIVNQYEPVAQLPYPAISLCSPNQITISAMKHFNRTLVDGNRTMPLEYILLQLTGFYESSDIYNSDALVQLQNLIELNRYNIPEVLMSLPQPCNRFLKRCFFRGRHFADCEQLFRPILTHNGLCCIFNSPYHFKNNRRNEKDPHFEYWKVLRADISQSLTVVTDYEPADAINGSIFYFGSTKVMFTDWNEFPADDESRHISSGSESFHPIHATYTYCSSDVKDLAPESRSCNFEDEHYLEYFGLYRNSNCDLLCLVRAVERSCHCLMFYVPNLKVQRVCNVTSIGCISDVKVQMSQLTETVECHCPRDCDSRRYTSTMAMGNVNGIPYMIKNLYKGLTINKSTSIMHFYFPTSAYVKQKQETVMSFTTLVSNLGGVFGLCLGCSVVSVLEVIFYTYAAARNFIRGQLRACRRRAAFAFVQ